MNNHDNWIIIGRRDQKENKRSDEDGEILINK